MFCGNTLQVMLRCGPGGPSITVGVRISLSCNVGLETTCVELLVAACREDKALTKRQI